MITTHKKGTAHSLGQRRQMSHTQVHQGPNFGPEVTDLTRLLGSVAGPRRIQISDELVINGVR